MNINKVDPYAVHDQVALLLPWYVNKSIQDQELKMVEGHLAICLTCRREMLLLEKLAQAVIHAGSVDAVAQNSFKQLKSRLQTSDASIEQIPSVAPKAMPSQQINVQPLPQFGPRALAFAAMLLLAFLLPTFIGSEQYGDNAYRTLANDQQAKANWNDIHVVFAEQTTSETIKGLLASVSGEVLGQPNEQSVYTVRFIQAHNKTELQNLVAQLRQHPQVIFAETAETNLAPQ